MTERTRDNLGAAYMVGMLLSYPIIAYHFWHLLPPKTYAEVVCCLFVSACMSVGWPATLLFMFIAYLHTVPLAH